MSADTQPYLFEMLARKTVVVWAEDAESARDIASDHLQDSSDWDGIQADGGDAPISQAMAEAEIRHGAIEDKP